MCSQDNLTWSGRFYADERGTKYNYGPSLIGFLPMNHIAGLITPYVSIACGGVIYFAEPDAMQGSILKTLQEVSIYEIRYY